MTNNIEMNLIKTLKYLLRITSFLIISSCKKGKGAICNDGSRSYSTGQGTCSWHGGVDHYVDPNEIDGLSTVLLFVFIAVVLWFLYHFLKDEKKEKLKTITNKNHENKAPIIVQFIETKRTEEKEKQERHRSLQEEIFKEIKDIAPLNQFDLIHEHGYYNATLKSQIYDEKLKKLISQLEIQQVWLNPIKRATLNIQDCMKMFPCTTKLSVGAYFCKNDEQFEIKEEVFLPMIEDISITGLSDKKFNLLFQGACNLKQIHFLDSEVREFQIEELKKLRNVSVSDSIGIPILKNLPALESLVIRKGRYRKNDFDKIQVYSLQRLLIYEAKKRNIPDKFDQFDNLELKLLN